jgi:integrase
MRHTFATLALSAGVPLEWISKQLRHANMEITRKHYARWLPAADSRWLDRMDNFAASETDGNRTDEAAKVANQAV